MIKKWAVTIVAIAHLWPVFGDEPKGAPSDTVIESPPSETAPAPSPSSKSKRKPTSQSKSRVAINSESKTFMNARGLVSERFARPLVVRTGEGDPRATAQLQEDLAVMSRILEKTAAEYKDDHEEAAGIPIVVLAGGRNLRSFYLEGYGVLFTMTVGMPLHAEPRLLEAEEKGEKGNNEEWNEARNELFGERRRNRGEKPNRRDRDPRQLEEFRNSMIEAMRNASNIRNLRPEDWVTLVVRGRGSEDEAEGQFDVFIRNGFHTTPEVPVTATPVGSADRYGDASTMVLRVKKAEVDKQKQSPDDFRKKVSMAVY